MTKQTIAKNVGKRMLEDIIKHPIRSAFIAVALGVGAIGAYNAENTGNYEHALKPANVAEEGYVNPYSTPERQWKTRQDGKSVIVERYPIYPSRAGHTSLTDEDGDGTVDTYHWDRPFRDLTRDANESDQIRFNKLVNKH